MSLFRSRYVPDTPAEKWPIYLSELAQIEIGNSDRQRSKTIPARQDALPIAELARNAPATYIP